MTPKERHPTLVKDDKRLNALFLDTPLGGQGSDKSRDDFGGPESCCTHLRVKGVKYDFTTELEQLEGCYGIYLGEHSGKWVVGVTEIVCAGILTGKWTTKDFVGFVEYDSLAELKQLWELD